MLTNTPSDWDEDTASQWRDDEEDQLADEMEFRREMADRDYYNWGRM